MPPLVYYFRQQTLKGIKELLMSQRLRPELRLPFWGILNERYRPKIVGKESTVTVTFKKQGEDTLMTLVHSNVPDHELARRHEKGWNYFLEIVREQFGNGSRKVLRREPSNILVRAPIR